MPVERSRDSDISTSKVQNTVSTADDKFHERKITFVCSRSQLSVFFGRDDKSFPRQLHELSSNANFLRALFNGWRAATTGKSLFWLVIVEGHGPLLSGWRYYK